MPTITYPIDNSLTNVQRKTIIKAIREYEIEDKMGSITDVELVVLGDKQVIEMYVYGISIQNILLLGSKIAYSELKFLMENEIK